VVQERFTFLCIRISNIDMAVENSWIEYTHDMIKNTVPKKKEENNLLYFMTTLVEQLIIVGRFSPRKKRGRPLSSPSGSTRSGSHSPTTTPSSSKSLKLRLSEHRS